MSLEAPEEAGTPATTGVTEADIAEVLGDRAIGTDDHLNAPAFLIRPDAVVDVLTDLRDGLGFDHLSCVTAQEYEDRYESIYHLKQYADPTTEVSIVVPSSREHPHNQSAEAVFRTADWHEREAYDLVGIEYEGHPEHRRILLPETWQGHPLSLDYHQDKPQIVPLSEHANPLQEDHYGDDADTMFVNIGPTTPPPTASST